MTWIERVNLIFFGLIGASLAAVSASNIIQGNPAPFGLRPWHHSPETFMIAGVGLAALSWKHKLYGFPLFCIAANMVELPWLFYSPFWNLVQIAFLVFGYVLCRPKFKNWVWIPFVIAINAPGGLPLMYPVIYQIPYFDFRFLYFHHMAEIATFAMFLFNIKSLKALFSKSGILGP